MVQEGERAIGITELADMLSISRDTAYALAVSGDVPAFKVGRLWRFWPSAVREALNAPVDPWSRTAAARARRRA